MDSLITAAGRALAAGDPLAALKWVALREDAPALALRGIAMAQLADFPRARTLLRSAARRFGPKESLARARCLLAEAEVALASRDLTWPARSLEAARTTLGALGDAANAAHAELLEIRWLLLIGRVSEAERTLRNFNPAPLPNALKAVHQLIMAGIHIRRVQVAGARKALAEADRAARAAGVPALIAEVDNASRALGAPAARLCADGQERLVVLQDVEALFESGAVVVDACRFAVGNGQQLVSLARRPVLLAIARELAEAWPGDVSRDTLVRRAFRARRADESYRARLRVEVGRLRRSLRGLVDLIATKDGFSFVSPRGADVVLLKPPAEEDHAALIALLADGERWSSSGLALALGTSQRTVQRALDSLAAAGKAHCVGRARSRRWSAASAAGITTSLLLPTPLPND